MTYLEAMQNKSWSESLLCSIMDHVNLCGGGGNRLEPEQGRGDQWGPVEVLMMIENRGVRRQASVSRV